jgi:hypothetical protein
VHAAEPETAYQKVLSWGHKGETSYENPAGQIKFRGISNLIVVIDPIEDGAELMFEERIGVPTRANRALDSAKKRTRSIQTAPIRKDIRPGLSI